MSVVEHRTIDHTFMVFCEVFQILVVGGNDAEGLLLPELLQHSFCYGTANGGLRAASELINQQ